MHVKDSGMSARAMTSLLHPAASGHVRHAPRLSMKLGRLCAQVYCSQRSYGSGAI